MTKYGKVGTKRKLEEYAEQVRNLRGLRMAISGVQLPSVRASRAEGCWLWPRQRAQGLVLKQCTWWRTC